MRFAQIVQTALFIALIGFIPVSVVIGPLTAFLILASFMALDALLDIEQFEEFHELDRALCLVEYKQRNMKISEPTPKVEIFGLYTKANGFDPDNTIRYYLTPNLKLELGLCAKGCATNDLLKSNY